MMAYAMRRKGALLQRFFIVTTLPCAMRIRQCIPIDRILSARSRRRLSHVHAIFTAHRFLSFRGKHGHGTCVGKR